MNDLGAITRYLYKIFNMLKKAFALLALCTVACSTGNNKQIREVKTLKIATAEDFTNIDPRKSRMLSTMNLMHFLYEGLYKPAEGVSVKPGVAQEVSISEDGKTYRFYLRPCRWSDGVEVTAQDFLTSWKTSLDPKLGAPNAYQLYVIKNAQDVYEGKKPASELGVECPDERTLVVTLESPNPAFMQMITTPPFFPVPRHKLTEDGQISKSERATSNGPYVIENWKMQSDTTLTKNHNYWASSASRPTSITFYVMDESTALAMYNQRELDWIGSPLSMLPTDALETIKSEKKLRFAPAAGTHFIRVNTRRPPFDKKAIRQAIAKHINRDALTEHILQGGQTPTQVLLPKEFNSQVIKISYDDAVPKDQFIAELPKITLSFIANDRTSKIAQALQHDLESTLGCQVHLQPCDSKLFMTHVNNGDYDLALGSWYADYLDPSNFLSVFEFASNTTNKTGWENSQYQFFLQKARSTTNDQERADLFLAADKIISEEVPIIPLYQAAFNFVTTPEYTNSSINPLGIIALDE